MSLGIYFGPKEIYVVESKGRKPGKVCQISQAAAPSGELEEAVPSEAKMIEMVALFKDELRRNKIEARDATLCLSGQDLIIRTFEVPQMPREELASAINFEAKKYIPFKIEDMITDCQVVPDKISRSNLVLFMGIKRDTFDRYISLLGQLNLRATDIEYSAFSVLRALNICKLSTDGVMGIITADLLREDEVNFVVMENGFPLFSRDIILSSAAQEADKGPGMALEKLKTEIRISLDYYNRKFPTKNIKRMYLVCNDDCRLDIETFITQIGPFVQFVDIARNIEGAPPFSLSFIKGYCASISGAIRINIKTNLLAAKDKVITVKEKAAPVEAAPLFEGVKIDVKMVLLGLAICIAVYAFGVSRLQPVKKEINEIKSARPAVSMVSPDAPYEELISKQDEFKKKLDTLNDLVKKQVYVTKPLNVIPRATPDGVWLTRLTFLKDQNNKPELVLDGVSYMNDSEIEFQAVNKFVQNLREDRDFSAYFKNVNVGSIDRTETGKITATNFSISCKSN